MPIGALVDRSWLGSTMSPPPVLELACAPALGFLIGAFGFLSTAHAQNTPDWLGVDGFEFATPAEVSGSGQGRGNSGIMLHGVCEVQVLDSFKNDTYPDGQAAAIYSNYPPLVNASRKPGQWQTYDIILELARPVENKLVESKLQDEPFQRLVR